MDSIVTENNKSYDDGIKVCPFIYDFFEISDDSFKPLC